jgi:hypothetical protein
MITISRQRCLRKLWLKRELKATMRTEHLLISLVGLLLGFILLFVGVFLFFVPYFESFLQILKQLITHHLAEISYLGSAIFFLGIVLLFLLLWLNRRRYLLIKMGTVSLQDRLIAYYAKESLQNLFPGQAVDCDVIVKRKKKVEILANLPFVEEENQENTLKEIEKELVAILHKQCQYDREFILNVSFSAQ